MEKQINGQLGDWSRKCARARPIDVNIKTICLELFRQGAGYQRAARSLNLKPYTVRDWFRRFKTGGELWATRDGSRFFRSPEAKDLIEYRHEIEAFFSGRGTAPACD